MYDVKNTCNYKDFPPRGIHWYIKYLTEKIFNNYRSTFDILLTQKQIFRWKFFKKYFPLKCPLNVCWMPGKLQRWRNNQQSSRNIACWLGTFCSLLVNFCSLLVFFCSLLFAGCSLLFRLSYVMKVWYTLRKNTIENALTSAL